MNVTINKFVGIFEDAYSKEYCKQLIKDYDIAIEAGYGLTRQDNETVSKIEKTDTMEALEPALTCVESLQEVLI